MTEADKVEILRKCFWHVHVHKIEVVDDPASDSGRLAKVYINEEDHENAIGEDGIIARRAAMKSGIDVEVVWLPKP